MTAGEVTARLWVFFFLVAGCSCDAAAQMRERGPYLSWDEFVDYLQGGDETADGVPQTDWDFLEEKALHPMQLNRLSREDLLALPFISEEQADSLLAYRAARRGILSLGELQLIKGFDFYTRAGLSLFVRCDSAYVWERPERGTDWRRLLFGGGHEVESQVDVPLYQRDGYKRPAGKKLTKANHYAGNNLRNVARYRYRCGQEAAYGLTTEKDAGEPVGKRGFYPYDYWSGYALLRPRGKSWGVVAGDYEIKSAQSLLLGSRYMGNRQLVAAPVRRLSPPLFRPHTSCDESRFFRGAAAEWHFRKTEVTGFASYRKVDATIKNDTVRTLLQTGLHRTISEIERRRNVGCLVAGAGVLRRFPTLSVGLNTVFTHYGRVVSPPVRAYNEGYFRGRNAAGLSAVYHYAAERFSVRGELAADRRLHWATEHQFALRVGGKWSLGAQLRHFTPRFVSLHGSAVQQAGRVANEQGVLLGARFSPSWRLGVEGYLDLFRFMRPTYTAALPGAKGMEGMLGGRWSAGGAWQLSARYRLKSVQRTVPGHKALEYNTRQSARLAAQYAGRAFSVRGQLDGCLFKRQTASAQTGWMFSVRAAWQTGRQRLGLKAFAAVFFTDSHDAALYAYEPQLRHAMAIPSFSYHGARAALLADARILSWLSAGVKCGSVRYFNRESISNGTERIASAWKNDLSLQVRMRF